MDLAIPRLIQQIIDFGITQDDKETVLNTTIVMVALSITSALFSIGMNYLSVMVGEGFARDLREAMFLKIQDFSYGNLDRMRTGQLIVRLTSDIAVLQRLARVFLRIGTRAPLLMIGSLILMVSTNSKLALYILPLLIIMGLMISLFIARVGSMYMIVQEKLDALNTVLQENIAGVRVVKAFVRDRHESQRFEDVNDSYTRHTIGVMQILSTMFPSLTGLINVGVVVIIWAGGIQSISGEFTIGEIVAFINYLLTTMIPLMIMAMLSQALAGGFASAERVLQVLHEEPEVQDQSTAQELSKNTRPEVTFENVSFLYNGVSEETILDRISLTAKPGTTVAILGATGSGKSTLINLIPRFYDPTEGRVLIDGTDIKEIKQDSLLSQIGIVPQETILFAGSVKDNIRYGKPDASDQDVIAAAKTAQAHDFIMDLPEQYNTRVEQRGVNLSGGQKQRIAIARAILTQPNILILDDSTSSVDVETESKIQAELKNVLKGRTSFVVAQRISTVLNADKIIVIDKGKIAAEGTHQELLASSPLYKEIYDSQLGDGFNLAMEVGLG
jgi:ATP-binding cassette subfamily B protein